MSPQSYTQRYLGDTCADMKPFTTMQKAGVVPFIEDDTRTHVRPYPTSNGWDELITEEQSVTVFRRNCRGVSGLPLRQNWRLSSASVTRIFCRSSRWRSG